LGELGPEILDLGFEYGVKSLGLVSSGYSLKLGYTLNPKP